MVSCIRCGIHHLNLKEDGLCSSHCWSAMLTRKPDNQLESALKRADIAEMELAKVKTQLHTLQSVLRTIYCKVAEVRDITGE